MQTPLPYITRGAEQYGTGFGGLLRIFRRVAPHLRTVGTQLAGIAKSAGKSLLKTGADTSSKILGDVLAGKKFKEAAEGRLQEAGTEITEKVSNKLKKMRGGGRRRRRRRRVVIGSRKRRRAATSTVSKRRATKRKGSAVQGGSGKKRRRVQRKTTKTRRVIKRHRRRDVFSA
jgi:hypothetical protein